VAIADEAHRLLAVEVLATWLKIDVEVAIVVVIVHPVVPATRHFALAVGDRDIHAAEGINRLDEALQIDLDIVINVLIEEVLDGLDGQVHTSAGECGVDLITAVPGDANAEVTRDGQKCQLLRRGIDKGDHERIGAPRITRSLIGTDDDDAQDAPGWQMAQ